VDAAAVATKAEWLLRRGSAMICAAGMFYLVAALTQINAPT